MARIKKHRKKSNNRKSRLLLLLLLLLFLLLLGFFAVYKKNNVKRFASNAEAVLNTTPWIVDAGTASTINWGGIQTANSDDWIGLYLPTSTDDKPIAKYYTSYTTGSCPSLPGTVFRPLGRCQFPLSLSMKPGKYEYRLFSKNSFDKIATSNTFTITTPILTANPSTIKVGESVTASWHNKARSSSTNWIGFFAKDAPNSQRIEWMYVNCTKTPTVVVKQGTCNFDTPNTLNPGIYELRFFDDVYGMTGVSNQITVTEKGSTSNSTTNSSPSNQQTTVTPTETDVQTTGSISGTIYGSTGNVISGAKIFLTINGAKTDYFSDAQGKYNISPLAPGEYLVTYVSAGYSDQKSTIQVTAGENEVYDVTLRPKK